MSLPANGRRGIAMPGEKPTVPAPLTFVNEAPAPCGCKISFSSGFGEYSDVHALTLCPAHSPKPFGPVLVTRDENGWWHHPDIPDFGSGEDPAPYMAWARSQGLEVSGWHLSDEIDNHPYDDGACHCRGWEPRAPGPEWFLMGIFETEDGPYVQWARYSSVQH